MSGKDSSGDTSQLVWCVGVLVALGMLTVGAFRMRRGHRNGFFPVDPTANEKMVGRTSADAKLLQTRLGLEAGKPAVIEFMDFECPPCRQSWPRLKVILKKYPHIDYRAVNFPLSIHPDAFGAAVAEEIGTKWGRHAKVFDDLFTGKTELDAPSLNKYLSAIGLPSIVGTDKAAVFSDLVAQDMKLGNDIKIQGTPTTFVLSSDGKLREVRDLTLIGGLVK